MKKRISIISVMCLLCMTFVFSGCSMVAVRKKPPQIQNKVYQTENETNSINQSTGDNTTTTEVKEYTNEQLCQMALDYYEHKNNYRPGHAAAEKDDTGMVVIQLYDSFSDHNSTSDWYTINPETGKGTNLFEESIDLTPYAK